MAPGGLTRDQFIEIVDKIVRCDLPDEDEQDKLLWLFENNVLHPRASSFIYFPEHELGPIRGQLAQPRRGRGSRRDVHAARALRRFEV